MKSGLARAGLTARLGLALGVGLAGLLLARWVNLPGGGFVGAMLATAIARLAFDTPMDDAPRWMRTSSHVVQGLATGAAVTPATIAAIGEAYVPVVIMLICMISLGLLASWVIHRITHTDLATALCGCAPGGLVGMVALADELDGNAPVVASMHAVRLASVVVIVPTLVRAMFPASGAVAAATIPAMAAAAPAWPASEGARLAILLALGIGAGILAVRYRVPAGGLIAGLFIGALLNPLWLHLDSTPIALRMASQLIIGIGVGVSITRDTLRDFKPFALAGLLMTGYLIVAGMGFGWLLGRFTAMGTITGLVGSSPGGAATMIILAEELGANGQLVAAMHVTRLLALLVLLPVLIRVAAGRGKRGVKRAPQQEGAHAE